MPTSTWSLPVTASGATPPSPTPKNCSSTCVVPRSSGSPHRGIEYWKQCADLNAADRDADTVHASRHLSASVTWQGTVAVDGVLDPLGGEVFKTELDRICHQLRLEDLRDGVERTTTQRRADALVEMAMRSATAPADGLRPRPLLSVTIGIDPFNHLCQTAAGTVIAPGLLVPTCPTPTSNESSTTHRHAASKRPANAASAERCAASSRSATNTVNTPPAATNPPQMRHRSHRRPQPRRHHLPVPRRTGMPLPQPHPQSRHRQNHPQPPRPHRRDPPLPLPPPPR